MKNFGFDLLVFATITFAGVGCVTSSASNKLSTTNQQDLIAGVDLLANTFLTEYAPRQYKKNLTGLSIEDELQRLRQLVLSSSSPSALDKRRAVSQFFGSLKDIHSRPEFEGQKGVWLGLHIKKTSNGYVVAWIDKGTPNFSADISVGDRVMAFDGRTIDEAVENVKRETRWYSTPAFEQSFAEWFLTYRSASEWVEIPEPDGIVQLNIVPRGTKKIKAVSLKWLDDDKHPPSTRCPFWGKTKSGYLPELGKITWRSSAASPFLAYIFRHESRNYGFIRFHTYKLGSTEARNALSALDDLVVKFQNEKIQGLVIDQLGNGGGNFILGYALLSRLTDRPLRTPLQRYIINENQLVGFGSLEHMSGELKSLARVKSDQDAQVFLANHPIFSGPLDFLKKDLKTVNQFSEFLGLFVNHTEENLAWHLTPPYYQFQERVVPVDGPRYAVELLPMKNI